MKRVLILAYYFPPLGGVGVHRAVRLVAHLHEHGYEASVLTGPSSAEVAWAPPDATLAARLPPDLAVVRPGAAPPRPSAARERLRRWLGARAAAERWWVRQSVSLGRRAAADCDVVLATMSPFGTAAAAAEIAAAAGKPWVADLQDPWALDEWTVYPSALHRALDRRRMRRELSSAAAVIMNTDDAALALRAELPSARVHAIPQGWAGDDFAAPVPERDDGRLRVVFAGYSHVERGETHRSRRRLRRLTGGAVPGLDILPRSHVFLLQALEQLGTRSPELAARIELHVAGAAPLREPAARGLVPVVQHGYLPHAEAISLMRSADVLFLPMHDLPPGTRARTVPGKTYEYLASGRPILAALPEGDARDLVAGQPRAWVCRPTDVRAMGDALLEIGAAGVLPMVRRPAAEQFEWKRLVARIATVLDEVL